MSRVVALFCWAELTWTLLSFTATAEQIAAGAVVSLIAALACAPLGSVAGPWVLLRPRRIGPLLALAGSVAVRAVKANLQLTRRIWAPRPPDSGMIVAPTEARTDAELTATGLLTSIIVDSQLVDADRYRHRLQYHVVSLAAPFEKDPVEARVLAVIRR